MHYQEILQDKASLNLFFPEVWRYYFEEFEGQKQGFFLIPLILILPNYMGLIGVWVAFPIADLLSMLVTAVFLDRDMRKLVHLEEE